MTARLALACMALALGLCCGCPQPLDNDALERNDTPATASVLQPGVGVEARAVQGGAADVYSITAGPDQRVIFQIERRFGEDCAAFAVTDPEGDTLYSDTFTFCGRGGAAPTAASGVVMTVLEDAAGYTLEVPARTQGAYLLTLREQGHVDNLLSYVYEYRLIADVFE